MKLFFMVLILAVAGTAVAIWQQWIPMPAPLAKVFPAPSHPASVMYKWRDASGNWSYGTEAPRGVHAVRVEGGAVTVVTLPKLTDVKGDPAAQKPCPLADDSDDNKVPCTPPQMRAPALERMGLVDKPQH